jgi:hypothetical protein
MFTNASDKIAISVICSLLLAMPTTMATAQDGLRGIAFVEAVEQSSGMCFADNLDKAFACAKEKCSERASPKDCLRVKWCYPALWSADLFVQHKDGPHWHELLCGWNTREDLQSAIDIACKGSRRDQLIECDAVQIWDGKGTTYLK